MLQRRIVPVQPGGASPFGAAAPFTVANPATMAESSDRDKVSTALYNMADSNPAVLFAGRYQLLQEEQVHGGQAVVHLARDGSGGLMQYAIKCAAAGATPPRPRAAG